MMEDLTGVTLPGRKRQTKTKSLEEEDIMLSDAAIGEFNNSLPGELILRNDLFS